MKKNVILLSTMMISSLVFSQVGINTANPSSTLDITAKNATGTTTNVDGLLVPRVDRQRAQSMTSVPTSTLIYVNSVATGTQTGTAANMDTTGYYYFDAGIWTKLKTPAATPAADINIYNNDGSLAGNRTVTQNANTLAFTGTAVNAFSVDGGTFSVDATNDRVGIGTAAPTTRLEVNSGIANTSGLKLSQLTSATVAGTGKAIGVDNVGNVITLPNAAGTTVTTVGAFSNNTAANFLVNDLTNTIIPTTSQNMSIPTGGKAVFINFMIGIDFVVPLVPGSGSSYYTAQIFIDGVGTDAFLTVQEPGTQNGQMQFSFSTVKTLTAGNHTIDVRMIRTFNNGVASGANMTCDPISISFNASFLN